MRETDKRRNGRGGRLGRFFGDRRGASALEFAILAPVFFGLVVAIVETFTAYVAEQVLLDANDAMARRIRMGAITFNMGRPTDVDAAEYRALFCEELTVLLTCSPEEATIPTRLTIVVSSIPNLSQPVNVFPKPLADQFSPGGKTAFNIVRAYYEWPILVDYLRLLTFGSGANSSIDEQQLVATAVIKNEDYE